MLDADECYLFYLSFGGNYAPWHKALNGETFHEFALRAEIDNYNTIQLPFIKPLALTAQCSVTKLTN
jgi:hypothetical protein